MPQVLLIKVQILSSAAPSRKIFSSHIEVEGKSWQEGNLCEWVGGEPLVDDDDIVGADIIP